MVTEQCVLTVFIYLIVFLTQITAVPYKDCGSAGGKVNAVVIKGCESSDVCKLKRGTNVSIEVDFTSFEASDKATSVVHGIIGGIPVPFPLGNPDACTGCNLDCPLVNGKNYQFMTTLAVLKSYPQIRLVVRWELQDGNSKDIFCLELPAQIVD
ncbi:hypothetical protein CHS0354_004060 [Potamilus streckersoni]|uniref:MD-2-related lipid-recognition domain-containing protein n=1 Tax=Potamilus streckersoni TaxID=2493646 RepID=A0AAE0T8S5_9BIVA|nr:hypothetical protein CHS0354_004060 [Potamilus streckersoni]